MNWVTETLHIAADGTIGEHRIGPRGVISPGASAQPELALRVRSDGWVIWLWRRADDRRLQLVDEIQTALGIPLMCADPAASPTARRCIVARELFGWLDGACLALGLPPGARVV